MFTIDPVPHTVQTMCALHKELGDTSPERVQQQKVQQVEDAQCVVSLLSIKRSISEIKKKENMKNRTGLLDDTRRMRKIRRKKKNGTGEK